LRAIYEEVDGVFLTGGVDIDPANYGEDRHELCDRSDPARDWTELHLVRWALADHKPLFGVCRGIQAINVACGGSLYQHIAEQHPAPIKHDYFPSSTPAGAVYSRDYLAHEIQVDSDSLLAGLLGGTRVRVNSMHHQGIKKLAPGLRACARAPDGLIEAVESTDGQFMIGVQWHPEELAESQPSMNRLFVDFIAAAGTFA
jgi:putative glutamine amidotransferase